MPYALQENVARRLGMEGRKLLRDRVELPARQMAKKLWVDTKKDLRTLARGHWDAHGAHGDFGAAQLARTIIRNALDRHLPTFRHQATALVQAAKREAYDTAWLRAHWVLDQVTPPNVVVRPSRDAVSRYRADRRSRPMRGHRHREAWADETVQGPTDEEGKPTAEARVDAWTKVWQGAALGALTLSSVMGDSPADVDARLDAVTANGLNLEDVIDRLISTEVQSSIADADDDFWDEWDDLLDTRVWQTMDDESVCPQCEENEGRSMDEVDDDIPAHPWCRCWERIIPVPFGSLAGEMAAPGDPRQMAIRNPLTGQVEGIVTVSFDSWAQSLN